MVRVLHLVPSFRRRGAEVFASELIGSLEKAGVKGQLLSLFPTVDELGVTTRFAAKHLPASSSPLGVIKALRDEIRTLRPDIILAHGGQPLKFAALARGRASKTLIVYRKIGLTDQWLGGSRFFKLLFQRWLMMQADTIISLGGNLSQELVDLFGVNNAKIRLIPNAIDAARFQLTPGTRDRVRQELALAPNAPVMISVGALAWEKNQFVMLRTFQAIKREFSEAVLLLVGDGPERSKLEQQAIDLGVADSVKFLGVRSDVPDLLAAADLFLLTSLTEGVPGVLIEAGMAGLPCVTWDVAGAKEVVLDGTTGYVTPYKDEAKFTEAICSLITNLPLARNMGEAAKAFCLEKFDIENCVREHIRLFEEVLARRGI